MGQTQGHVQSHSAVTITNRLDEIQRLLRREEGRVPMRTESQSPYEYVKLEHLSERDILAMVTMQPA